ncbi:MAG TPA: MgtC/SapB family protein [Acidimicrobiales bacterium]|nr:MgtC/SapB family protein [Acidimicrobiales bacterium]
MLRILIGTVLGYGLGFERELRGSPAGDRTFSLVGAAATAITAVAFKQSPQTVAGVVTGIGFIGGGVVFQGQGALVRGITTAATVFVTAAVGILVGAGQLLAGVVLALLVLVVLEVRHLPALRYLDAHRYQSRFKKDVEEPDER